MQAEQRDIFICDSHQEDYPTPLISTFAFNGSEYWCPYCGNAIGMFDGGTRVVLTEELKNRYVKYLVKHKEYLNAWSVKNCSSMEWEGKRISPNELPQEERDRLKNIRETGFTEGIKIEDDAE